MNARLQALVSRIDALSLRERALVAGMLVAVLWSLWNALLMAPLKAQSAERVRQAAEVQARLDALSAAATALAGQTPELIAPRQQAQDLEAEIAALDAQLGVAASGVIAPQHMTQVLGELLRQRPGLTLVSMRSLPPVAVKQSGSNAEAAWRHGIEIVVDGGYLETLRYLEAIEAMPHRINWDSVELQTVAHPVNRTRIVVQTLGLAEDLLGG